MTKIVGVRFRTAGKVYYFDPKNAEIKRGQHVIVETSRGVEYGHVVVGTREVAQEEVVQPLKPVFRVSTEEDDERVRRNREKERDAMKICREKIRKHNLEMKLIDAEYTFDNNKILFYFTADGRVDFRELVKDLAVIFKMRIELRQIGVRDETKILGSVGICGRPLCCHTFLSDFAPVSIKMAKEQNLSLNPTKISGVCGRLMCCLKNEQETYEYLNSRMPKRGDQVTMEDGRIGSVHSVNVLRQTVRVLIEENDEKEMMELPVTELTFRPRRKKGADRDREAEKEMETGQSEADASGEESGKEKKQNRNRRQDREKNREKSGKTRDGDRNRESGQKTRDGDRNRESGQKSRGGDRSRESGQKNRGGDRSREQVRQADQETGAEQPGERTQNAGRRQNRNSAGERRQAQNRELDEAQEQGEPRENIRESKRGNQEVNETQEQGELREQNRGNRESNEAQDQDGESRREERRRDNRNRDRRRDRSRNRNRNRDGESGNRSQEGNPVQATESRPEGENNGRQESGLKKENSAQKEKQPANEGRVQTESRNTAENAGQEA